MNDIVAVASFVPVWIERLDIACRIICPGCDGIVTRRFRSPKVLPTVRPVRRGRRIDINLYPLCPLVEAYFNFGYGSFPSPGHPRNLDYIFLIADPSAGSSINDLTRMFDTGVSSTGPSSLTCTYSLDWKNPSNGSVRTVISPSHLTETMLYQFGTTSRNGKPCWGGKDPPFICQAIIVSSCNATSRGRLRMNFSVPPDLTFPGSCR